MSVRPTAAQYADAYVFSGVSGPNTPLVQAGGGLERVFANRAAVSVECGLATNGDYYRKLSHFTVNALYHANASRPRLDPFVVAGFGMLADWDMPAMAVVFGGGLNYWVKPSVGVRVEFKDNVAVAYDAFHMPGVRVGITLR